MSWKASPNHIRQRFVKKIKILVLTKVASKMGEEYAFMHPYVRGCLSAKGFEFIKNAAGKALREWMRKQ